MTLTASPIYAGLLGLLFLFLSVQVIRYRRRHQVSLGDKGDSHLEQLIRAQGNCAEYATVGLILLAVTELQGATAPLVHGLGAMLVAGRLSHGIAFSSTPMIMPLRVFGMALTLAMLGITSIGMLLRALL